MSRFSDADLGVESAAPGDAQAARSPRDLNSGIPIPDEHGETIEIPATRSSMSGTSAMMHHLSLGPSTRDRRGSRNSFGTSLPIPRSPRMSRSSRLSRATRPSVVGRDIMASQVQDMSPEKVAAVKNMAFAFDIDGVLVHGNNPIQEGRDTLKMLNGDNELGKNLISIITRSNKKYI